MKVVEIFRTLQGEGRYIGVPSVFLRLGRCNLHCSGCDTKWDVWREMPVEEVIAAVGAFPESHLVITGGEPTLWQKDIADLLGRKLGDHSFHRTTIETNGAVPITSDFLLDWVDTWSFSPKVGSLGKGEWFKRDVVIRNLRAVRAARRQVKYVVDPDCLEDLRSVMEFHDEARAKGVYFDDDLVFFQPLDTGTVVNVRDRRDPFDVVRYSQRLARLSDAVGKAFGHRVRVLPQLHKYLIAGGGLKEEVASARGGS